MRVLKTVLLDEYQATIVIRPAHLHIADGHRYINARRSLTVMVRHTKTFYRNQKDKLRTAQKLDITFVYGDKKYMEQVDNLMRKYHENRLTVFTDGKHVFTVWDILDTRTHMHHHPQDY